MSQLVMRCARLPGGRFAVMGKDVCAVCGNKEFEFAGLQWWPMEVIVRKGWKLSQTDPARPDEGAVSMVVCTRCRNSHLLTHCSPEGGEPRRNGNKS
jgi:hypothetical protein